MSYETNPFRLSMLQRSESPYEGLSPHAEPQPAAPSGPQPPPARVPLQRAQVSGSNPFRVDLSDGPAPTLLEPPPYYESEVRRHSDPNISDEKSRLQMDESYREGYERGIRMARERERERQRQRRREREARGERSERGHSERGNGERGNGERGHSERGHSERGHSDRYREYREHGEPQSRQRSKSESATRSTYRHGHSSHRSSSSRKHPAKPNESLDVIDKMDVTGFYGPGTFHHDGPFDACTPHRNKSSCKNAIPIAAFPADGPNNSLAVESPTASSYRIEDEVYGRQHDQPPEVAQSSFDPHDRGQPVHGQRTYGLGSTTFLDGAPASRDAIEQAGRERSVSFGRSKSLLRRAGSGARRPSPPQLSQRRTSDDATFDERDDQPKASLLSRVRSLRSSGRH